MFASRFFAARFFAPHYFPEGGAAPEPSTFGHVLIITRTSGRADSVTFTGGKG